MTTREAAQQLGITMTTLHQRRVRLAYHGVQLGTVEGNKLLWTEADIARVRVIGKAGRPVKTTAVGTAKDRIG
jgi:hypothetical protein